MEIERNAEIYLYISTILYTRECVGGLKGTGLVNGSEGRIVYVCM